MALAIAVVSMMVLSGVFLLNSSESSAETQSVTYYPNGATGEAITIPYEGIVATEYNPLYWKNTADALTTNWIAPRESHNYGGSVGTMTVNMVFAGWSTKETPTSADDLIAPGDVIPDTVTKLWAYWAFPDIFRSNNQNYEYTAAVTNTQPTPTAYGNTAFADRMYTTQYSISGTLNFGSNTGYAKLSTGSYRSLGMYTGTGTLSTFHLTGPNNNNGNAVAQGNVVIDNVIMTSIAANTNHGYADNVGLYANAHKMILGANIQNNYGTNALAAPQLYGGGTGSTTGTAYSQKAVVSKDDELNGMKFNMGSFVIVHSGTYYSMFAGGRTTMGSSSNPLSTYLVIKNATVLDTVGGGNATNSSSYPIYGSTTYNTQIDQYQGGTFVYAIGLYTLGDSWAAGITGYNQPVTTKEGANFQGGCSYSSVNGSTHVFVSGNSSVWDVQGGGRAGTSKCAFTYVEISGNAEVRHAACGLVTDGTESANTSAKGTKMMVVDNPRISMLFGAGYDTWTNPTASNMSQGKTIEVDIRGGTIGFVYGGGYRGTVGSSGNDLTVSVNISGGDVLFDVFGGGRGGVDKMIRTTSGRDPSGNGYTNSTGQSVIYGDVSVNISGGHIHGNVYAGGESVPKLTRYYGTQFTNNESTMNVAQVFGTTSVTINGNAVIDGSVYGSGKGIGVDGTTIDGTFVSVDGKTVVTDYYTKNLVLSKSDINGGWTFLEWYNHSSEGGSIIYDTSAGSLTKYQEYAKTSQNGSVTVESGTIGGSVYGGGAFSKVDGSSSVSVTGGEIATHVYGGGLGKIDKQSVNYDSSVSITGGKVGENIYGGSAYGIVNNSSRVSISGTPEISGSVYGAGLGEPNHTSVNGDSTVTMASGTVKGSVYGGSAYGIVDDATVTMNGGSVLTDIYGGGLGTTDINSVRGNSSVTISNESSVAGDVYGGAAFGITAGNSQTTLNNGTVAGNVFAGGLGTVDHDSVKGTTSVVMNNGTVSGTVYGGCAFGITVKDSSATVNNGTVMGDLYGGGLGKVDHNSVLLNSSATLNDGTVNGSMYGGCAYGITVGNASATVNGGTVRGNVFAGGLGTETHISVRGKRYLLVKNGNIGGSIYGGSSRGDDASEEAKVGVATESSSSAYVAVSAGTIGGSVYGGGYKGKTTGTTYVYVGYSDFSGTKSIGRTITIGNSVYGGGDVGELTPGEPAFVDTMVYGGSQVYINGENTFTFTGTFSAAGNSCLTAGETSVLIEKLNLAEPMESVQRTQTVTLVASNLKFNGKVNGSGDNTKYAFYGIDELNLKGSDADGNTIYLYAPMSEIGEYNSLNASGGLTKPSAPINRLYICNGTMFEVRQGETYGNVNGYTLLSIRTVENYYGALTLGAKGSPGGFVVEHDGTYTVAYTADFANCMCWFITGSLQTVTSSTLIYESGKTHVSESHYINVPTLDKNTSIRYSGGFFTSESGYTIVDSKTPEAGKYSILLGTKNLVPDKALTLAGGDGMFLPASFDSEFDVYDMDNRQEQPQLEINVYGINEDSNKYVGYGMIYLQEVVPVEYLDAHGDKKTDYIVQNRIEVRVDIYIQGSTTDIEDSSALIQTIGGKGSADILIPATLSDYSIRLVSATTNVETPLFVSAAKNSGGTTGWNYPLNSINVTGGYTGEPQTIQSLTGAFIATLQVSVTDFVSDTPGLYANFTFQLVKPNGDVADTFNVHVDIKKHPPVHIKFIDENIGIDRAPYSFEYSSTITEADCPNTLDNFVGWYTDPNYINQFNFNTPLLTDMTLHARYMYSVYFDYQNGMGSTMYVNIVEGGTAIYAPKDPAWDGYTFVCWSKSPDTIDEWYFAGNTEGHTADVVTKDETLYAIWEGKEYTVSFKYTLGGVEYDLKDGENLFTITAVYGSPYGTGIDSATALMTKVLEDRSDIMFVRWQLPGTNTLGVYNDTVCRPPASVYMIDEDSYYLEAEFTHEAIAVHLDLNAPDSPYADSAHIESPVDYLLYPDEHEVYTIVGNNATCTGYRIIGWAFTKGGADMIDIGSELPFDMSSDIAKTYIKDGKLTLYAVWEQIKYTITIVAPIGGTITATYDEQTYTTEFEAYYGDEITIKYDGGTAYQFSKWVLSGQGTLANDTASETTLSVIGSCAIYAQLRPLSQVTVHLYLDGGTNVSGLTENLWLYDGNNTYAKFSLESTGTDVGGTYGVYMLSSKLGSFNISLQGTDGKQYILDTILIAEDAVSATVYAVTVTSTVTGGSLENLPEYTQAEKTFTFDVPKGKEVDGKLHTTYNSTTVDLDTTSVTVPADIHSGIVISGALKDKIWVVTLNPRDGFTYKIGDDTVTTISRLHGTEFGTLPSVYDSNGYLVGSEESAYKFGGWWYDESCSIKQVQETDKVEDAYTLYSGIVPKDYDVTFNANGGTGTMEKIHIYYGTPVTLPANTFTRAGTGSETYTFMGWSKTAGGGVAFSDGETVTNVSSDGDAVELFAVWLHVVPYSGEYDGVAHKPTVEGAGATIYYSTTEALDGSNYSTKGTTECPMIKDAGTHTYYYYVKDAKVGIAGSVNSTITAVPLTVKADSKSITYGQAVPEFTATATGLKGSDKLEDLGTLVFTCSYEQYGNAGTYDITVTGASSSNYIITIEKGLLTVNKKELSITGLSISDKVYDGTTQVTLTGTPVISGLEGTDEITLSNISAAFPSKDVSTTDEYYTINITYTANGATGNYILPTISCTAKITPKAATITSRSAEITYGEDGKLTLKNDSVDTDGFVNAEGVICTGFPTLTTATTIDNVFEYEMAGSTLASNYVITVNYGKLTIRPATIVIESLLPYSGDYDGEAHNIASNYVAKAVDDQTPVWQFSKDGSSWADMIQVTNSTESGTYKYRVTADNHTTLEGDISVVVRDTKIDIPVLENHVYDGNPYDPTEGLDDTYYTWTSEAKTDAGDYSVTFTLRNPANNSWKGTDEDSVTVIYKITKAPASATIEKNNRTYNGVAAPLVTVSDKVGGEITFSVDDPEGTYSATIPERTDAGTYKVYWKLAGDSNHEAIEGNVEVTIAKATPSLTPVVPTLTYNGLEQTLLTDVTAPSEVTVKYSLDKDGTYTETIPTAKNAGTYTVYYKTDATANYTAITNGEVAITIAKATYNGTINFINKDLQYNAAPQSIEITASEPIPAEIGVVYTPSNTFTDVGEHPVTVSFNVGNNYYPIPSKSATLKIYVKDIKYTPTGYIGDYDGASHPMVNISLTEPVSATITYSLDGVSYTTVCSRVTDAGSGTVYYRIAALGYETVNATATYEVRKVALTFTSGTPAAKAYDGTALTDETVTLTVGSLISGHSFVKSVTGSQTNAGTSANTFTVTIRDSSDADVTANYNITYMPGTLTIDKAIFNHMTFPETTVKYDGTEHELVIVFDEGYSALPAGITVAYTGNKGTEIGDYNATATFTVNGNYQAIDPMQATLHIVEIDMDIAENKVYKAVYDGAAHNVISITVTSPAGAVIQYSTDNVSWSTTCPTITDVGTQEVWYKITAEYCNDYNGHATAEVTKRAITYASSAATKVYDGTPLTLNTGAVSAGSLVTGHAITATFTGAQTDAGSSNNTCTIVIRDSSDNDVTANYSITYAPGKLTVEKATYDTRYITFAGDEVRYDGAEHKIEITVDGGHPLPADFEVQYTANKGTEIGVYNATAHFKLLTGNYNAIEDMHAVLTIRTYDIEYTATVYNAPYDGVAHKAVEITVSTAGSVVEYSTDGGTTYSTDCPEYARAGSYPVKYRITSVGYDTVNESVTVEIEKLNLSVSSASGTKTYDGTPLTAPALTISGSTAAGQTTSGSASGTITNVGEVTNTISFLVLDADSNDVTENYIVNKTEGTLKVTAAPVTITIETGTFMYDGQPKEPKATAYGLAPGDAMTINLRYSPSNPVNAGTYAVSVRTISMSSGSLTNYEVDSSAVTTMTILPGYIPAPKADTTVFVYNGTIQTYTIAPSNMYTVSGESQINAGTYTVTVSLRNKVNTAWESTGTTDDLTYEFTIGKRTLSVVANQVAKSYGEADPEFTYSFTGAVTGESPRFSGSLVPLSSNMGNNDVGIGTLAIGDNGAFKASNYEMTFNGTARYTINPVYVTLPPAPGSYGVLYYTGEELTAYEDGTYYTVVGGKATEVGTYTATLVLKDTEHYIWSDTQGNVDRTLQYKIILAPINLTYTAYQGAYDGHYHPVVTINDYDGADVVYSYDLENWSSEVPQVKSAAESGIVYIKATKVNHATFNAEVPFSITKVALDVYIEDKHIDPAAPLPEFTISAQGLLGDDTVADLTAVFEFATDYAQDGTCGVYHIYCLNEPEDASYEITVHDGKLSVYSHMAKVIWEDKKYYYNGNVQDIKVVLQDENGNDIVCDVTVTDLDGNPVQFIEKGDYIVTVNLPDGYMLSPDSAPLVKQISILPVQQRTHDFFILGPFILLVILLCMLLLSLNRVGNKVQRY